MKPLLFTRVREVRKPNRANSGDAGIDFYVPHLTDEDIRKIPQNENQMHQGNLRFRYDGNENIYISLVPGGRVLIPSGVRVLIDPRESMLMAANKSGVATKRGLLYTAEIVDSTYTGEVHIGVFNSSPQIVDISLTHDEKLMQFVHVPVILSTPVEVTEEQYKAFEDTWGTRGASGFGSSDNK